MTTAHDIAYVLQERSFTLDTMLENAVYACSPLSESAVGGAEACARYLEIIALCSVWIAEDGMEQRTKGKR